MVAGNKSDWDLLILKAIKNLGDDSFFDTLCAGFQQVICLNKGNMILTYLQNNRPGILAHGLAQKELNLHVEKYQAGLYLLDPFYQAALNGLPFGFYRLEDVAPDDFHETEFYLQYYREADISDDLGYCFALGEVGREGDHIHVSFSCYRDEVLSDEQISDLREMEPIIKTLVLKHLRLTENKVLADSDSGLHRQLMQVMNEFGSSILTNREREVLQMILHGHSSQSVADKLEMALRTVKLHRQNLYQKLDISSQAELFYLFIDSLTCVEGGENIDPLTSYLQAPT